ncbi:FUSC family protein [Pseudomonas subflava]|uniref:FUSC family protein n=1 Tax=Pseudomonas subflava TaxID=2952933 RepID=UPI002079DAF8|nr:FUSC family protein [Pseudomonas subflava]
MRDSLSTFVAPHPAALQFAAKTLLAGALALWCAFRFDLEQPQWALMTAFIVAQPLAGMVVQKGLARLLGTLIVTALSVLFMALFAQAPWLFLLVMALWLGLCTAASTLLRSAWAYSFVLAGYTVAIICLPITGKPLLVFDEAVARCTEICLGILCSMAVSAVLWPQRVEQAVVQQARAAWQGGVQAAAAALQGRAAGRQGLLETLGRIVAVDAQREHAWFEGSRGRQRARGLRALTRELLGLLRLARGAARQWQQLDQGQADGLRAWLDEVRTLLAEPDAQRQEALYGRLLEASQAPGQSLARQYCLGRLALVVRQLGRAQTALGAVERGEAPQDAPPPLSWHRDVQTAAVYGLRSCLTLLVLSAFWLATGWPAASGALLLAAVVCSLFASRENADLIGMAFMRGIFYALPVAFFVGQVLLPQWNGFPLLCLALGVPLFFGLLAMAKPALAGAATSFCLHFIVLCAPRNDMVYDVAFFLNEALAMLIGVGCAVLALRLIVLRNPVWHGRRLLKATLDDLARLCSRSLGGAENWFGGRMADRLLQLARFYPQLPEGGRSRWDDGIDSLDLGDELLHLRACLAAAPSAPRQAERRFFEEAGAVLRQGPAPTRGEALEAPAQAFARALRDQPPAVELSLAEAALLQLTHSWRHWCARQGENHGAA